jgi:leucyl/phenylalanyl-tRNA--protein transferase
MLWFCPDPRGVLDFQHLHVPRSLQKFRKSCLWKLTVNQAFESVMRGCQITPRPGQNHTWITEEVIAGYLELFRAGLALSVEVWEGQELIGGIYGVLSPKYASAESMFYRRSNASKIALLHLIEILKSKGYSWVDIQIVTEITLRFGAKEIPRLEFLKRIGAIF